MTATWIPRLLPGTPVPDFSDDAAFRPGVYDGMPEDAYHADPVPGGSLSASGAKKLLPPGCPARYRHDQLFGAPPRKEFDYGTAAHKLVLGTGPEIVTVDAPDWRTRAAKEARDQARLDGKVPLLLPDFSQVQAMAAALRGHPVAGPLLDPGRGGTSEQSLFWTDSESGIWRRARLDHARQAGGRLVIAEYKTCEKADAASARKAIGNYRYHLAAAQYVDGVIALGLDDDPGFVFVFQEKCPPWLVHVLGFDDTGETRDAIGEGRQQMRLACEIWRDCTETGIWPGYNDYDISYIALPRWAQRAGEDLYT